MRNPIKRIIGRFKQKRKTKIDVGEFLGGGARGHVFRTTVRRGDRSRIFALKRYLFHTTDMDNRKVSKYFFGMEQYRLAKKDLAKILALRDLGFPTVPFPVATKKGLLTKDLSENDGKKVVDFSRANEQFYRLHGEPGNEKVGWDTKTLFRIMARCKNAEELAVEYEYILARAKKLGINLGAGEAFIITIDKKTNIGKIFLVDVNEVHIPDKYLKVGKNVHR